MELIADRFELGPRIAEGGMGTVYRARDRQTGRDVAIKIVLPRGDDALARFAREGSVLDEIRHEAIVGYIARGATESGQPWLAMEWIDGETLQKRLESGPLSIDDTLRLAKRVAAALGAAHARGLVHRDIKPSNLILRGGSVDDVVIVDFGIVFAAARARPRRARSSARRATWRPSRRAARAASTRASTCSRSAA